MPECYKCGRQTTNIDPECDDCANGITRAEGESDSPLHLIDWDKVVALEDLRFLVDNILTHLQLGVTDKHPNFEKLKRFLK